MPPAGPGATRRPRAARRAAPTVVVSVALAVLSACTGGAEHVLPLPPPPSTAARPPTTPPPDYRAVALPVATGSRTTTTVAVMGPGQATVRGRVVGPDGSPVVGANVRVERLVGGASAAMDVVAGEDGAWSLPDVLGGGYRIRAWRAPDLAQVEPNFVFVGAKETAPMEQKLGRYSGITATPALAPVPPVVGQPAALAIQVTDRSVDAQGVVQGVPVALAAVQLDGAAWAVGGLNPTTTDGAGRARWEVVCGQAGPQPLRLLVNGAPFQIALPGCAEAPESPPPTAPGATTTRVTTTTRPGATPTTAKTSPGATKKP